MSQPEKILLVQTAFLGDTVLSTPVISVLKRLYPGAELWLLVRPPADKLFLHDDRLADVLTFDKYGAHKGISGFLRFIDQLSAHKFTRAYALQRSLRTALLLWRAGIPHRVGFTTAKLAFLFHETVPRLVDPHDALRNLSILRNELPTVIEDYATEKLFLSSQAVTTNTAYLKDVIVFAPGSAWETKRWKDYPALAELLVKAGHRIAIVGAPEEKAYNSLLMGETVAKFVGVQDVTGKLSLPELLSVIENAKAVVCNDSMVLHVASAYQKPTVTIFCATSPSFGFGPWQNPRAQVVELSNLWCKPCRRHGSRACPTGTELCMRGIPVEDVAAALQRVLKR